MHAQITLTPAEADEIIAEHFKKQFGANTIVITEGRAVDVNQNPELDLLALLNRTTDIDNWRATQKIAGIKKLREMADMQGFRLSLGNAKYFLEALIKIHEDGFEAARKTKAT